MAVAEGPCQSYELDAWWNRWPEEGIGRGLFVFVSTTGSARNRRYDKTGFKFKVSTLSTTRACCKEEEGALIQVRKVK
jgi:hypothetical protein